MQEKKIMPRLGIAFLVVIAFCTFFSRAISNMLMPHVRVAMPGQMRLAEEVSAEASLRARNGELIELWATDIPSEQTQQLTAGQYCEFQYASQGKTRFATGTLAEISVTADGISLWIKPVKPLPEDSTVSLLRIPLSQQHFTCVIPGTALVDRRAVYIVKSRDGFWGEELYLEYREVIVDFMRDGLCVLADGLETGEYVVIGWDRPLRDGKRVVLPFSETY